MSAEEAVEDLEEKADAMLEDAVIIGILFGVMAAVALISALVSAQKFSIKADPGSCVFSTPGSGIGFFPDPGSRIPDPKPIFLRA